MAIRFDKNGRRVPGDYTAINAQITPCYLFNRSNDGALILECNHARRLDWLVPLMGLDEEPDYCRFESIYLPTKKVRDLIAHREMKAPSQNSQSYYWHLPRTEVIKAAKEGVTA